MSVKHGLAALMNRRKSNHETREKMVTAFGHVYFQGSSATALPRYLFTSVLSNEPPPFVRRMVLGIHYSHFRVSLR